jgi:hypothetical protein
MTMGEGGFVACKTPAQEVILRSFREWGRGCYCIGPDANKLKNGTCKQRFSEWIPEMPGEIFDHKYVYDEIGYNLKPIEMQSAMGLIQLEKLDEINAHNYQYVKSKHINYVDSVILHFESTASALSQKNLSIATILTVFGLRPSFMGEKFIYTLINMLYIFILGPLCFNGWMTYKYPTLFNGNLPKETPTDISLIQTMGQLLLGISIGFYLLYFFLGLRKISKYKKEIQRNIESKIKFETYNAELLK